MSESRESSPRGPWVRRLFGGGRPPAPYPGEPALLLAGEALHAAEALVCDALFVPPARARLATTVNAFARSVDRVAVARSAARLRRAMGAAMAGQRVGVFVGADGLAEIGPVLARAVNLRVPLVLHVEARAVAVASAGLQPLLDSGAFVYVAGDLQQSLDLTLLVRRVAELSLTPGVLLHDGPGPAEPISVARPPSAELVREYVGAPQDEIEPPTPAQRRLFGDHRSRLPGWFDPGRPVCHGASIADEVDRASARAGRRVFFQEPLPGLIDAAAGALATLTGRANEPIDRHRMDGARRVLVASGAAVAAARDAVEALPGSARARIGVLGLRRLRPLPVEALRSALAHVDVVTVLERTDASSGTPVAALRRELAGAIDDVGTRLLWAGAPGIERTDLAAVLENLREPEVQPGPFLLDAEPYATPSRFPKRRILLEQLRRDYPDLDRLQPGTTVRDRDPAAHFRGLTVILAERPDAAWLGRVLRCLSQAVGPHVSGQLDQGLSGAVVVRLVAGPAPWTASFGDIVSDGLVLESPELLERVVPGAAGRLAPRAALVVAAQGEDDALARQVPAEWCSLFGRVAPRWYRITGDRDPIEAAADLITGEEPEQVEQLTPPAATTPATPAPTQVEEREGAPRPRGGDLPLVVRRQGGSSTSYESVARFWGELVQPRKQGEPPSSAPDPYVALGTMPALTSTMHDVSPERSWLPWIDEARCTGCGDCWASCPDAAIAPVAPSSEALLQFAIERAEAHSREAQPPGLGKLRRLARALAARMDSALARSSEGRLDPVTWRVALEKVLDAKQADIGERAELGDALQAALEAWPRLGFAVTARLFREPHAEHKGSGSLLGLAINPQSCQACGVCVAACGEDAIHRSPQTAPRLGATRAAWQDWEDLPDTAGKTIARVQEAGRLDGLAAILLSRHTLFALAGGDGAEPGSGERLATRQVLALVEYAFQRRRRAHLERVRELDTRLKDALRQSLTPATALDDLAHLEEALARPSAAVGSAGGILERLEQLGESTDVDVRKLRGLARAARELQATIPADPEAEPARYGLVVATGECGPASSGWSIRWPRNPFAVPVVVEPDATGLDLALGLARGQVARHLAELRAIRRAELRLAAPADLPRALRDLETLAWGDLSAEERAGCPPLVVIARHTSRCRLPRSEMESVLSSDLPVKLLLLDDRDLLAAGADATIDAIAFGRAAVAAASVTERAPLYEGVLAVLEADGPALLHFHAPSPRRDGFAPEKLLERARGAVAARVHPIVHMLPGDGPTARPELDLSGNPDPDQPWADDGAGHVASPAHWATGESRFDEAFLRAAGGRGDPLATLFASGGSPAPLRSRADEPLTVGVELGSATALAYRRWRLLRELAAGSTLPGADAAVPDIPDPREELEAARKRFETQLQELEQEQASQRVTQLRDRLMQLAGYGSVEGRE